MEFKYKGINYKIDEDYWGGDMLNTTPQFQLEQFQYCIKVQDWKTLENRITNMLKWGGLKKIS